MRQSVFEFYRSAHPEKNVYHFYYFIIFKHLHIYINLSMYHEDLRMLNTNTIIIFE